VHVNGRPGYGGGTNSMVWKADDQPPIMPQQKLNEGVVVKFNQTAILHQPRFAIRD
jgi:hypothetical protein